MVSDPVKIAREMRKKLTPPEARLWVALKALREEGYAFRRQTPVAGFYLDFACLGRRLAVEVDGRFHDSPDAIRRDLFRDRKLAEEGFLTVRFRASDIRDNLSGVMAQLKDILRSRPNTWD